MGAPPSLPGLAGLDLAKTLDCGQAFRWRPDGKGFWEGSASGRSLRVGQSDLSPLPSDPFWAEYFDLGFDYQGAEEELARTSPAMARVVEFSKGIRILRQDPWETLASFIISQNNNIKRIKLTIGRLVQAAGGRFPAPEDILRLGAGGLGALGLGYRDAYLLDAAAQVAGGALDLKALEGLPSDEAALRLKAVKGVGEKVASCVLLFGFHRLERFPRDVWIKRIMARLFDGESGQRLFGPLAGLAQQHLFYWGRERFYLEKGLKA